MSFLDHPLVCQLPSHHHFPVLAMPHSIPRQKSGVLFSYSPWHSHPDKGWAFFLTNSYSMHLMILAHSSLFWVVCHPSRIFPQKELEREPQNKLPPFSPPPDHTLSYLWLVAHCSYIGSVQVGGAWVLYVLHFHVSLRLVYRSCICHGLGAYLVFAAHSAIHS